MMKNFYHGCLFLIICQTMALAYPTVENLQKHIELCKKDLATYSPIAQELTKKILDREREVLLPMKNQAIQDGLNWAEHKWEWMEQNGIRERVIPGVGKSGERHLTDSTSTNWFNELKNLIEKRINPLNRRINSCNYGIYCLNFIGANAQAVQIIKMKITPRRTPNTIDERTGKIIKGRLQFEEISPSEQALLNEYNKCQSFLQNDPLMKQL